MTQGGKQIAAGRCYNAERELEKHNWVKCFLKVHSCFLYMLLQFILPHRWPEVTILLWQVQQDINLAGSGVPANVGPARVEGHLPI